MTEPEEYECDLDPFTEPTQMPIEDPERILRRREIMRRQKEAAKEPEVRTPSLAEIEQFHTDEPPVKLPNLTEHKAIDQNLKPILEAAQELMMITAANIRKDIEAYFAEAKQRFGDKADNGSELERLAANVVMPVIEMIRTDVLKLLERSA